MSANQEFMNPERLPAEQLSLVIKSDGVQRIVKALDPHWVERRDWRVYRRLPSGDKVVVGAFDAWNLNASSLLEDLKFLLSLRHHRFWSHLLYEPRCMDAVVSFLQEAEPPYVPTPQPAHASPLYEELRSRVANVLCRIVTERESDTEWMMREFLGKVMYEEYLISIPTLWDFCLLYGLDNPQPVGRFVSAVLTLQPRYQADLETAIAFVQEVFKYTIVQVNNKYNASFEPPNLPETFRGLGEIRRSSQDKPTQETLTLNILKDLVLHLLDSVLTIRVFVEVYPPAIVSLKKRGFILSIVQLYEYAIPAMYEKVDLLASESRRAADEISQHMESLRVELLAVVREQLAAETNAILCEQSDKEKHVAAYLAAMLDMLSEKVAVRDYNALYPVHEDLELLRQAYPDMDSVKTDFILQAIYSNLDEPTSVMSEAHPSASVAQLSRQCGEQAHVQAREQTSQQTNLETDIPCDLKEESLISEVKDILPHLGEGFILKCLQHYRFNSESVINSILEGNLDASLQTLDQSLPIIPPDPVDEKFLETGIERLNIFDGDEFDVMTRDDIDRSRVHRGKRKDEFKDLKQMLDDKTFVKQRMDIYTKYRNVVEEENVYSDEYDDTYDAAPGAAVRDGDLDDARRPTVRPRVLQQMEPKEQESSEDEAESAGASTAPVSTRGGKSLDFCVNPELVRERREASRRANQKPGRAPPAKSGDVIGKARGQGQEKEVLVNRERKNENKSSRANHNRRQGAQWKRSQGMMPS